MLVFGTYTDEYPGLPEERPLKSQRTVEKRVRNKVKRSYRREFVQNKYVRPECPRGRKEESARQERGRERSKKRYVNKRENSEREVKRRSSWKDRKFGKYTQNAAVQNKGEKISLFLQIK